MHQTTPEMQQCIQNSQECHTACLSFDGVIRGGESEVV